MLKSILTATAILIMLATTVSSQICGDVNEDGTCNITDITTLFEFFRNPAGSVTPFDSVAADCDGKLGISVSDCQALVNINYLGGTEDCSGAGAYSFASSPNDTIFVPRMYNVPSNESVIYLPVITSFEADVDAVYMLFIDNDPGGNDYFDLYWVGTAAIPFLAGGLLSPDTGLIIGTSLNDTIFTGRKELFTLEYHRSTAGIGDIVPLPIDGSGVRRIAVERNGDLLVPVVQYYDFFLPDTLFTSPSSVSLTAMEGATETDIENVLFSSSSEAITFDLTPSEGWIILDPLPGPYTTPVTVSISADPGSTTVGDYSGVIAIAPTGPQVLDVSEIAVELSITEYVPFPVGDFNCNGIVDISDLILMVQYMFSGGPPMENCD